jgi:hypothetical protein
LAGSVGRDEGTPRVGEGSRVRQGHHAPIGHLVHNGLTDIVAVPARRVIPIGRVVAMGMNDTVGRNRGPDRCGSLGMRWVRPPAAKCEGCTGCCCTE